jgi:hypothetical protein
MYKNNVVYSFYLYNNYLYIVITFKLFPSSLKIISKSINWSCLVFAYNMLCYLELEVYKSVMVN